MWRTCSQSSKKKKERELESLSAFALPKQPNTSIWRHISICRAAVYTSRVVVVLWRLELLADLFPHKRSIKYFLRNKGNIYLARREDEDEEEEEEKEPE
ncbi:hypothetical protein F2P81_023017 [Scophthalmus maximus]|uniref:Uncharacterized protein n=1 Tax=Scophthalmus maximus TaxID=52904 RepID=A0A6A4RVH3_SCOMX|nr:hypothetical protein F2P81_023017 [Scophthalmus maximus]